MQAARTHRGEITLGEQKAECQAAFVALCRVSYVDIERVRHEVQVDADSLYEAAVGKAVHHFRAGLWHGNPPGPSCEFDVQIWREHPVSYKIGLTRVEQHAHYGAAKGPKDVLLREKLRGWLGIELK